MFKVLLCVGSKHNPWLVVVAALVCVAATCATFFLYSRVTNHRRSRRWGWLCMTGLVAGSGIWTTHFVAMLAFSDGLPTGYDGWLTFGALGVAVASTTAGFAVGSMGLTARGRMVASVSGGGIVGVGITLMHYLGMSGYRTEGVISWDWGYVASSVAIGVTLAAAALLVARPGGPLGRMLLGSGLLAGAIVGMHFTGMTAVTIFPDARVAVPEMVLSKPAMVATTVAITALIMITAVGGVMFDNAARNRHAKRLRQALEAMPAALAFFDANDRLLVWNANYGALFPEMGGGLHAGLSLTGLVRLRMPHADPAAAILAARTKPGSIEQQLPDGRWLRYESRPTDDGGIIVVGTDITELKRQATDLAQARDQAEAASRAKSAFLANISHEIRTPLNGVTGLLGVLLRTPLNDPQRDMVTSAVHSADTVNSLLGDVLDLARIEAGQARLETVQFRLEDELRALSSLHAIRAAQKGVALRLVLDGVNVEVEADQLRLRQVLNNLLANAVKFTEAGEVTLTARAAGDDRFHIEVRDTGIGFEPAEKERLFQRFAQGDSSVTRRFGGAGLGLAIARECAELMGGRIDAESQPGQGAAFTFDVPLRIVAAPDQEAGPAAAERVADNETRDQVLIVDDNPTNRKVLEIILDQIGMPWKSVEDGRQAVEAARHREFAAILMDIQMPVMDGITATREIRRLERQGGRAATPVIMVSANCQPEHVEAGRVAGAQGHLSKPINVGRLVEALNSVLVGHAAAA